MISYRKLAMRVLGHPLRVPTNTPRPASHRVTALALTAAMVAGMAAPAYAGTYYIDNEGGDITVTKDTDGTVYVKRSKKDYDSGSLGDKDEDGEVIIKSGKGEDSTKSPGTGSEGGNSSEGGTTGGSSSEGGTTGGTSATSEDSESEDKVYLGAPKGNVSSNDGSEENEPKPTEKDQTGENTGTGSSDPENTGSDGGTSGSDGGGSGSDNVPGSGGSDTKADTSSTTGGEENAPKPGDSPAPESQIMYTSVNDGNASQNESNTALKTAAENFTSHIIRIINNFIGNSSSSETDKTLNVTLDNVNIKSDLAALSVEGAGNTTITLEGKNTLTSGNQCAGLEHNEESTGTTGKLTITSGTDGNGNNTGSLTATGGGSSAGIGSSWGKFGSSTGAGTIEIAGGDIKAIGASGAAGIGSGERATGKTEIIISGNAKIEAESNKDGSGAGIGSGYKYNGETTITINGGTIVKAQGGFGGAGIGSGDESTGTTNIIINSGTIEEALGGKIGDGIGSGSGNRSDSTTVAVKINGGTIKNAQGGQGYGSLDAGSGIYSKGELTISGKAHIVSATGGNGNSSNSRSDAGDGIRAGTLTISGEAQIDNTTGGTADSGSAGDGIYSYGKLTIKDNAKIGTAKGGDATANGKDGGCGIRNHGQFTMSGGTITNAVGGTATGRDGGDGIYCGDTLTIEGGEIKQTTGGEATGDGGYGIRSNVALTIKGGKIEQATGGDATGSHGTGGSGIGSNGTLTIAGGEIQQTTGGTATGTFGTGGSGIRGGSSNKIVEILGGIITKAKGGDGETSGGYGIRSDGDLTIKGGTIGSLKTDGKPDPTTGALGGNAAEGEKGGHGIYSGGKLFISDSADITNAKGGDGKTTGGNGIHSESELTISGGKIEQTTGGASTDGTGGYGIRSGSMLTIEGGTITNATGGSGKSGGHGIYGTAMKILSGTIETAKGGQGRTSGGHGIYGVGELTIQNATITNATGNNAIGNGGNGIYSDGKLTIENSTIKNATGGSADSGTGGTGIRGDGNNFKLYIYNATIENSTGGSGKWGGSGILGKTMEILTSTIQKAIGGRSTGEESYHTGGAGIAGSEGLTIKGGTTVQAVGGDATGNGTGGSGIRSGSSSGNSSDSSLSISGGTISATGGNADSGTGGAGIASSGTVSISGYTTVQAVGGRATGENGTGGSGILSGGEFTISPSATIKEATGGNADSGTGGSGIRSDGIVKIWGGTITKATGGNGKSGGDGVGSYGNLTISGSANIGTAQGGTSTDGNGGSGISSGGILTISGSANITNATGGASTDGNGGDGIHSSSVVSISGDTITKATGGNATGENSTGGSGIGGSFVNIAGGTINTTGGSGKSGGAGVSTESGIVSIGNSDTLLDITATSPDADNAIRSSGGKKLDEIIHLEENGMLGLVTLVENNITRLFHNGVYTKTALPDFSGSETHPLGEWVITKKPTCTEPGERQHSCKVKDCVVTETEELPALGHQWSGWMPVEGGSREYRICAVCNEVEYRDVSHNSGDSTISTGLRVLDPAQADILQNTQLVQLSQINDVLYIDVVHETASLQGVLSDLTGLRSENIETVVFSTERCTSTLSLSDVAALGADDTPFTLSHSGSTATFIVGGADHTALLR